MSDAKASRVYILYLMVVETLCGVNSICVSVTSLRLEYIRSVSVLCSCQMYVSGSCGCRPVKCGIHSNHLCVPVSCLCECKAVSIGDYCE